ncbi:MAG TPA: alpha/beta hydrolase [Ktedonobacterales bacterium]
MTDEEMAALLARLEREAPEPAATLPYGDAPQQFGQLRLPDGAGPGPYPLVIVIHGGYWRARYDLAYFGATCGALARAGLATWNIEYRRIGDPGGAWPGTFADVAAAADYVRDLARAYPLDLARVITLGHSAGGHLALWLAARPRLPEHAPLWRADPLPLAVAIALAGVVDLREAWALGLSDNATGRLMRAAPLDDPERYDIASPYEALPLGVRQVLLHGDADESVPIALSARYAERAQAFGDDATFVTLAGAGHFEPVDPATGEWRAVERWARTLTGL